MLLRALYASTIIGYRLLAPQLKKSRPNVMRGIIASTKTRKTNVINDITLVSNMCIPSKTVC